MSKQPTPGKVTTLGNQDEDEIGVKAPAPAAPSDISKDYTKKQKTEVSKIDQELKKGASDTAGAESEYRKKISQIEDKSAKLDEASKKLSEDQAKFSAEQLKKTEQLTKWQEGIITKYEDYADISSKFREEIDKQTSGDSARMKKQAQQDYLNMTALGGKAMQIGLGAGGPVTGAQQQIMMAQSGAAATDAYSAALNRISAIDEQRRAMGFNIASASFGIQDQNRTQERANRQQGFDMGTSQIQTGQNVAMDRYNVGANSLEFQRQGLLYGGTVAKERLDSKNRAIESNVAANIYAPTAGMEINTTALNTDLGLYGQNLQRYLGEIGQPSYSNNPTGPSMGQGFMQGAATGAGVGSTMGPWGALAGGVIGGVLGAYSTKG